jgi:hypothetical protein
MIAAGAVAVGPTATGPAAAVFSGVMVTAFGEPLATIPGLTFGTIPDEPLPLATVPETPAF